MYRGANLESKRAISFTAGALEPWDHLSASQAKDLNQSEASDPQSGRRYTRKSATKRSRS